MDNDVNIISGENSDYINWFKKFLKPLQNLFLHTLAHSLFINILALSLPIFVLQVYDRVVFHAGLSTLQGLSIGMGIVLVFDLLLRYSRSKLVQYSGLKIDIELNKKLFTKLMNLPLRALEKKTASFWHILFRDIEIIRNNLSGSTLILASDLPFAILFIGLVFIVAKPVAWTLIIITLLFVFLAYRATQVLSSASQTEQENIHGRDAILSEILTRRSTIKALHMKDSMEKTWATEQAHATSRALERGTESNIYINATHGLAVFTTIIMTSVGALAIVNQDLTIGGLIAANMLAARIITPLGQLVGTWKNISALKQSMKRLHSVFCETEDKQEYSIELTKPEGKIKFDNIYFSYATDHAPALNNISMTITPLSLTGIIGHNGSGKSTLLKVLMGLYLPTKGRLTIDNIDIKQLSKKNISDWIGYVPQETVLFDGTIRENIALTYNTASDEEIITAAKTADAHQMIIALQNGYDTIVGEAGDSLSGGMRQRIAIARALIKNPDIIVMDEPSANLDEQAEQNLCRALLSLTSKKTIILITHSKSILQICRSIVVLQAGEIKEIRKNPKSAQEILETFNTDRNGESCA